MKQSQRCYLPRVKEPLPLKTAIERSDSALKLIADEKNLDGSISINSLNKPDTICIFTGPEGGFTEDEVKQSVAAGCKVLNLGKRKYRSETAAIVSVGLLLIDN
jgi:16S rRNA (uracil1498-N3)-methyltransferase